MATALMYAIRVVQQVRIKNLENTYLKNDSLPKKLLPVKIKKQTTLYNIFQTNTMYI